MTGTSLVITDEDWKAISNLWWREADGHWEYPEVTRLETLHRVTDILQRVHEEMMRRAALKAYPNNTKKSEG